MDRLTLNTEDIERLERAMKNIYGQGEELVNGVLRNETSKSAPKTIQGFINVGARNRKVHARNANPFKTENINLGLIIKSKGGAANKNNSFGYLVFPNEGRGKRNPVTQNFSGRGIEKERPKVTSRLFEVIEKKIKEEL